MVIFDLDGTLVDSAGEITEAMEQAWQRVFPGRPFPAGRIRLGPPLAEMIAGLDPGLSAGERRALSDLFRQGYDASDFSRTLPYPGIDRVLAAIGRCRLATNKRRPPTLAIADRWFPGCFDRIACSDGVWPDDGTLPASKAEMLEWLSQGEQAVVVGDTAGDVAAARAAGLRVVAVTWGYGNVAELSTAAPDALVHRVEDLLAVLGSSP